MVCKCSWIIVENEVAASEVEIEFEFNSSLTGDNILRSSESMTSQSEPLMVGLRFPIFN